VQQLLLVIGQKQNVECLADKSVDAIGTFFTYLKAGFTTVTRTLDLLTRLLTTSSKELRHQWAEEICKPDHFVKLMGRSSAKKMIEESQHNTVRY